MTKAMKKTTKKRGRGGDESGFAAGLAAPARRALASAGITRLEQLSKASEAELMRLHGMGPNAMKKIRAALRAAGLTPPNK